MGGLCQRDPYRQRPPRQRPHWTETPGKRHSRQRSPYRGPWKEITQTETIPDRDPWTETLQTETPLDREPRQRPPGKRPPGQRPPDRDPWRDTPLEGT